MNYIYDAHNAHFMHIIAFQKEDMDMEKYTLIQRHKSRGIRTWYIRISNEGKVSYKSTSTSVKTEAMKIFVKFAGEREKILENKDCVSENDIDVVTEAQKWLDIQENKFGSNGHTYKLYRGNINILVQYLEDVNARMLPRVTKSIAQGLANKMMRDGKKASTISEDLKCIRIFFKWIIDTYDLHCKSPFVGVLKPRLENHIVEFWTSEECDLIIANVNDKYYRAFYGLQCYAGLRYNEARKVMIENVNGYQLTIRQDKKKNDAVLPISNKLKALLDDAIGDRTSGSIFAGHINNHDYRVAQPLKDAVIRARLEGKGRVFMHRLRHSFASNLLRGGVDIKAVQTLGRWSSPNILLKHYAGVIPDDLKDAVNKL